MDNSVSARFFRIETEDGAGGSIESILSDIAGNTLSDRERNIGAEAGDAIHSRLERLLEDNDYLVGEFIRRQTANKPPEANAQGLSPLQLADGGGLGHSCAFRLHKPTQTMCLQNNPSGLSIGRVRTYLTAWNPRSKFNFERVPTEDALERFRSGDTRAFQVSVASPTNLPAVEGDDTAEAQTVVEAARMLGTAFEGMTVSIEVSMGRAQGELPKGPIMSVINTLVRWKRNQQADVRRLRAKSKDTSGEGEAEFIDFLQEFLQEKDKLDLPDNDPARNYELRRDLLSLWYNSNLPYLTRLYG